MRSSSCWLPMAFAIFCPDGSPSFRGCLREQSAASERDTSDRTTASKFARIMVSRIDVDFRCKAEVTGRNGYISRTTMHGPVLPTAL